MNRKEFQPKTNKQKQVLLNDKIPFSPILLIDIDQQKKEVKIEEALEIAKKNNLDLLCVSPNSELPVCKLIDYQKINYLNQKRKKTKKIGQKELRISSGISPNDLEIKLERAIRWVEKDIIVKFTIRIPGFNKDAQAKCFSKCLNIITQLKSKCPKIELNKEIHQEAKNLSFTLFRNKKIKILSENE